MATDMRRVRANANLGLLNAFLNNAESLLRAFATSDHDLRHPDMTTQIDAELVRARDKLQALAAKHKNV